MGLPWRPGPQSEDDFKKAGNPTRRVFDIFGDFEVQGAEIAPGGLPRLREEPQALEGHYRGC